MYCIYILLKGLDKKIKISAVVTGSLDYKKLQIARYSLCRWVNYKALHTPSPGASKAGGKQACFCSWQVKVPRLRKTVS